MNETLRWAHIMLKGLWVTLELTAAGGVFTVVIAVVVATCAASAIRAMRFVGRAYIDVFRSIPVLVMLLAVYFVLGPEVEPWGVSDFWQAAGALSVVEAAYLADIYRAGIGSVPKGQWYAGRSIGLNWLGCFRSVILPQAMPVFIPATTNAIIYLIKDSALASMIAVSEVTLVADNLVAQTFRPMKIFLILAGMYLILTVPLTLVADRLEKLTTFDASHG